jgi:hypothetical protein
MKNSLISALFAAFFCLFVTICVEAQDQKLYSWTDENGTVHFSDKPTEGQNVQEIDIHQSAPPVSANPYQEVDTGPSAAEQRREEIARKSEENQVNRAEKSAECGSWQSELERLEPHRRVFHTNDKGETERMDDVERTDRVAELKAQIARNCK